MARLLPLPLLCMAAAAADAGPQSAPPALQAKCSSVAGTILGFGHNIDNKFFPAPSLGACCELCQNWTAAEPCKSWTYHANGNRCYLHETVGPQERVHGAESGVPHGTVPPPSPPPPPPQRCIGQCRPPHFAHARARTRAPPPPPTRAPSPTADHRLIARLACVPSRPNWTETETGAGSGQMAAASRTLSQRPACLPCAPSATSPKARHPT